MTGQCRKKIQWRNLVANLFLGKVSPCSQLPGNSKTRHRTYTPLQGPFANLRSFAQAEQV